MGCRETPLAPREDVSLPSPGPRAQAGLRAHGDRPLSSRQSDYEVTGGSRPETQRLRRGPGLSAGSLRRGAPPHSRRAALLPPP